VFPECFSSPKTLVGCDDYGAEPWVIESRQSVGIDDCFTTTSSGGLHTSKVEIVVERAKNGVKSTFTAEYDESNDADEARVVREMREWFRCERPVAE
jgi:hypothetical protein